MLGARRRVLGKEHPHTLTSAGNLASSLWDQGKYAEAERIHREVLGVKRRVLGEEHPSTLNAVGNLAQSLSYQGKHAEAEEMLQVAPAAFRSVLGSAHPDTLVTAHFWFQQSEFFFDTPIRWSLERVRETTFG